MMIQWLGHSCFKIASDGHSIVLDPYADGKVPGLRPLRAKANEVFCSHDHGDHNAAGLVRLLPEGEPSRFAINKVESAHDDEGGRLRGMNTIHVLEENGIRVAHLGDLGAALTSGQIEAIGPLDAVLIPVGGHYTVDAATAKAICDALAPTVIIPMHYRSEAFGYEEIAPLEVFLRLVDNVVVYDGDTVEITRGMPKQVAVLRYMG